MITRLDTARTAESTLEQAFGSIRWIGELPLSQDDFENLAWIVRCQKEPGHVPYCTFATSMVFSARFAEFTDDESIQFWGKYQKDVWQRDNDSNFQTTCRDRFRQARAALREQFGFDFPDKEEAKQDVVSGVYLHAILPRYLQDDFADFFLKILPEAEHWRQAIDRPDDELERWLTSIDIPPNTRRRLKHFITGNDTRLTAARLTRTLATAACWYSEGQEGQSIRDMLVPIEQAVWDQLVPMLHRQTRRDGRGSYSRRAAGARTRWAWLYDENDILELQVTSIVLKAGNAPDRVAWLPTSDAGRIQSGAEVPDYGAHYCEVNAWKTHDGFHIDSATLIDVDQGGVVVPVDEHDIALSDGLPTSDPPSGEIVFFRIQPDGRLAVQTERGKLTDGRYAISRKREVALCDGGTGQALHQQSALMVPRVLRAIGHDEAGVYALKLPVKVGDEIIQRARQRQTPLLEGAVVPGLLPGALPVFEHGDVWVSFTLPARVRREHVRIRLTLNEDEAHTVALPQLPAADRAAEDAEGLLRIPITDHLPDGCLFQVEVFTGMDRLHSEPLIAALLPRGVRVIPSDTKQYYTLSQPPALTIHGVAPDRIERIELASDADVSTNNDSVQVMWKDPRQDAALRLQLPEVSIPLTFDVRWMHAWAEPLSGNMLWETDPLEANLHVRGAPRTAYEIRVADGEPRRYELNARGVFDTRIRDDALIDLLSAYHGALPPVTLSFRGVPEPIALFTLVRPQFEQFEVMPALVKRAVRALLDHMRASRRRPGTSKDWLFGLVPPAHVPTVNTLQLPSPFPELAQVRLRDYSGFEGTAFPQRRTQLHLSPQRVLDVEKSADGYQLSMQRRTSNGPASVSVSLRVKDGDVWAEAPQLCQCERCMELFWEDDTTTIARHGHGEFSVRRRSLTSQPVLGQLVTIRPSLEEIRKFGPNLSKHHDREAERSFRMDDSGKRAREQKRSDDPLSADFHRFATAGWRLKSNFDGNLSKLRHSSDFVRRTLNGIADTQTPALACAAGIIHVLLPTTKGWGWLDPTVLTLALLARSLAHGADARLTDDDALTFEALLKDAQHNCPELLTWALCWMELIFTHWSITES